MHDRRIKFLPSEPEKEAAGDEPARKWVPKKKHEVLKAKYKCLKKLFQIYDAGVMGMLPPADVGPEEVSLDQTHRKLKRSRKPKTDTATGTSEICLTDDYEEESCEEFDAEKKDYLTQESHATVVTHAKSTISTQADENSAEKALKSSSISKFKDESTQGSQANLLISTKSNVECDSALNSKPTKEDYYMGKKKRSKFKFQSFIRRLFGVRPDGRQANGKVHNTAYCAKRKRGPLRIKGQSRSRNVSESGSKVKSPAILTCVQSVQKDCLTDTTPRRCPIVGCEMTTNGIINYNDHLNIAHFPENKFICNYCHKGFELEEEKIAHENEHIGINKLGKKNAASKSFISQIKSTSVTQTEPQAQSLNTNISQEKINKIINFIEKIPDPDRYIAEVKNQSYTNVDSRDASGNHYANKYNSENSVKSSKHKSSDRKVSSCGDIKNKSHTKESSATVRWSSKPSKSYQKSCCCAAEELESNRYRNNGKKSNARSMYTKTNNSPTMMPSTTTHYPIVSNERSSTITSRSKKTSNITSYDGSINIKDSSPTLDTNPVSYVESCNEVSQESEAEVSYDTSTNIIYYTSKESCTAPSTINSAVKNMGKQSCYNWEPSKKVIRV